MTKAKVYISYGNTQQNLALDAQENLKGLKYFKKCKIIPLKISLILK